MFVQLLGLICIYTNMLYSVTEDKLQDKNIMSVARNDIQMEFKVHQLDGNEHN